MTTCYLHRNKPRITTLFCNRTNHKKSRLFDPNKSLIFVVKSNSKKILIKNYNIVTTITWTFKLQMEENLYLLHEVHVIFQSNCVFVTFFHVYRKIITSRIKSINNNLHLVRKYAQIFVRGHYLFSKAHSFTRTTLSEKCSHLGQISKHIFTPRGGFCLYMLTRTAHDRV